MKIDGVVSIHKQVGVFVIVPHGDTGIPDFRVTVLETERDGFIAHSSITVKNPETGFPEGVAGIGDCIESAVEDMVRSLFKEVAIHWPGGVTEESFIWTDEI